ncbi:Intraflagellar transport protein IFT57 [Giardia duodenalis]|uniref:Intraflagellar transport protein 57 n=1 Tax=Giardia intestinalis (strain ATCC 50803 / WB clone C6) TaxID=184922 RepID=IFT57_GIAIC|nr:Intraflagellar transport protein IFT57 [Giardia intestinalis]A8B1U4.1 RecName: Full=Intraflagellar transport protein 57; Short=IFT57; AltName: Full=IFT complex B; AltName: Full=Intraflagellar transport protein IFT57 [Giardia lamblia ATCC 50803]KAE8302871.1 Intraflagellar transport protein IFT57 [Giardia intestinalis]|eukprot:XP_001709844.1 IFT complex B [Giardia lamblia ATCC 50803]
MIAPRLSMPAIVNAQSLVAKLRQLNCEKNYCHPNNLPGFTASAFYKESSSPLDQLVQTARLCHWLLSQLGISVQGVSEFDDPIAISTDLLVACKDIVNVANIPPHRIRMGYGDDLTALVLGIADACLAKLQPNIVSWKSLGSENANAGVERDNDDDDAPILDDLIVDDALIGTMTAKKGTFTTAAGLATGSLTTDSGCIAPGLISEADWEQELMAVDSQLGGKQLGGVYAGQDWRKDVVSMSLLAKALSKETGSCAQSISGLVTDFGKQLERISTREQHLNSQVGQYSAKLGDANRTHAGVTEELAELSQSISALTGELSTINEKLRALKVELQVESARASDTSNIHIVKTAFSSLSGEIRQLDLRITLAQQRLFSIAPPEPNTVRI